MADNMEEYDGHHTVDLGFAEKCEDSIYLSSLFHPSKLGGRPAWLRWDGLPKAEDLQCGNCGKQMILLCQIYVPLDLPAGGDSAELYHRTLYLFCCREGPCSKSSTFVKVFRTEKMQLSTDVNYDDTDEDELDQACKELEKPHNLCNLCGCVGDKLCSSCHNVRYCCKEHQATDWKNGHKKQCHSGVVSCPGNNNGKHPLLFNEYEIVIEDEPAEIKPTIDMSKYTEATKPTDKKMEKDLLKLENKKADETFANFRERINREPDQIIRYDLGKQPLWVSAENIPKRAEIPRCSCGSERQFEFQVLPQMINYLGVETTMESIDWGTLCVYTCADNCTKGPAYKTEFVWKQDFSQA